MDQPHRKATDAEIEAAAAAFWGVYCDKFPEVTSGGSQCSGEDHAALALWANGDPGDRPTMAAGYALPHGVELSRVMEATRAGMDAARQALPGVLTAYDGDAFAQLRNVVTEVLHWNYPRQDDEDADAEEEMPHYEILCDQEGRRVWINGADGSSIGRFNKDSGVDVHRTAAAQMQGEPECLNCTHGAAGKTEWDMFREEMMKHYDIDVPEDLLSFDETAPTRRSSQRPR